MPVDTNIVIVSVDPKYGMEKLLEELKSKGILAVSFGKNDIRFVTHLDFNDDMLEIVGKTI